MEADPIAEGTPQAEIPWLRLDKRMIGAALARILLTLAPVALAWLVFGQRDVSVTLTLAAIGAAVIAIPISYIVRYLTFSYRVTPTELQIRSGLLFRSSQRVPLHRIRTVDIMAKPVLRLFSLAIVTVGTGQKVSSGADELQLDAVRKPVAAELRTVLLAAAASEPLHTTVPDQPQYAPDAGIGPATDGETSPRVILSIRWKWAAYQIIGIWSLVAPVTLFGVGYQVMSVLGQQPDTLIGWYFASYIANTPLLVWIATTTIVFLLIGISGALLVFVEAWWNYRLTNEGDGRFVATRGLLTTRSFTVDQSRLRGVTLVEVLTTRLLGGARLTPILTGISARQQNKETGLLMPTTSRDVPVRVADILLGEQTLTPERLAATWLHPHPRSALRRIIFRYEAGNLLVAAALWATTYFWGWTPWLLAIPAALALLLLPAAVAHYRALGHRLADGYLFSRRGFFYRRTDAVQLRGISGVTVSQTIFQRRLRLASVSATTAAGEQSYWVVDVPLPVATHLAARLWGPDDDQGDSVPGTADRTARNRKNPAAPNS